MSGGCTEDGEVYFDFTFHIWEYRAVEDVEKTVSYFIEDVYN
jgi:hypothetical protein